MRCSVWQVRHAVGGGSSASAAGTPRTPRSAMATVNHLLLPHPQYVYAARCHPTVSSLVVTGCFDGAVRVWGFARGADPRLSQPVVRVSNTYAYVCVYPFNSVLPVLQQFHVGLRSRTTSNMRTKTGN